jgi:heme oxygenase (biliverdin-IX-beta and delta-forming)
MHSFLDQPVGILKRLKASTSQLHERVEQRLQIFSPQFDLHAYIRLVTRFYGFWSPLEVELRKVSGLSESSLALDQRLRAHLLEADLRAFGIDPAVVSQCDRVPNVQTFSRALGCLYVVEGSTLGAQFIARHLSEKFQIGRDSGGAFFCAYEGEVIQRWSDFRAFLILHANTEKDDEILSAARDTFQALDEWLSPLN